MHIWGTFLTYSTNKLVTFGVFGGRKKLAFSVPVQIALVCEITFPSTAFYYVFIVGEMNHI